MQPAQAFQTVHKHGHGKKKHPCRPSPQSHMRTSPAGEVRFQRIEPPTTRAHMRCGTHVTSDGHGMDDDGLVLFVTASPSLSTHPHTILEPATPFQVGHEPCVAGSRLPPEAMMRLTPSTKGTRP